VRAGKQVLLLALAVLAALIQGCGADTAGEGFAAWRDIEFSEETLLREEAERATEEALLTDEEKREETLKEYEKRLAAAREEEARLVSKLADIRGTEALPELSEELRESYAALAALTEKETEAVREEIKRLTEDAERVRASGEVPEEAAPREFLPFGAEGTP
jgi:predicted  nucleic acid-binding Zn-ribbon protein